MSAVAKPRSKAMAKAEHANPTLEKRLADIESRLALGRKKPSLASESSELTRAGDALDVLPRAGATPPTADAWTPAQGDDGQDINPYEVILEAAAVLRAAEYGAACSTDMYWGVISLGETCSEHVDRAQSALEAKEFSESLHEEASTQLAGLLGVLYAVNTDAVDDILLHAATRLVALAKYHIDREVEKACEVRQ